MTTDWRTWARRAQLARKEASLSQADVAAAVSEILELQGLEGVGRQLVSHWETGRRTPDMNQFFALCQAIGADPGVILFNQKTLPAAVNGSVITNHVLVAKPAEDKKVANSLGKPSNKAKNFKAKRISLRRVIIR